MLFACIANYCFSRWAGYDVDNHAKIIKEYARMDEVSLFMSYVQLFHDTQLSNMLADESDS